MACQSPLSSTVSWMFKFMSIEWVMLSNPLIICHCLFLLLSIFPRIRVFSNESALHFKWPKYWNFSFSISPSNEYSGLISFRIDWFDHLAVPGTLKSLLQHHNWKASSLWCSAFFMVQFSYLFMTSGKTIEYTIIQVQFLQIWRSIIEVNFLWVDTKTWAYDFWNKKLTMLINCVFDG